MKRLALLTTTCLLAACAQDAAPPPLVSYVPATAVPYGEASQPALRPVPLTVDNPIPAIKKKEYRSAAAKLQDALKKSRVDALEGTIDGAYLRYPYQRGKRYRIVVQAPSYQGWEDGDVTLVTLGPDDGTDPTVGFADDTFFAVERISTGQQESMRAKRDKANAISQGTYRAVLPIKCGYAGETTTMYVNSPVRSYLFDVECTASPKSSAYNSAVEFTYGSEEVVNLPRPQQQMSGSGSGIVADTRYDITGAESLRPREWTAWNDGADTYIRPSPSVQTRPVPMLPASAQFWVDPANGNYVIKGLQPEMRFPWGGEELIVRRQQ